MESASRTPPPPGPILGLDVGDRRIGVALSDPTASFASPLEIYQRVDHDIDVQHVVSLLRLHDVTGVVVGLPKNMNGSEGPQALKSRDFAETLSDQGALVHLWDERLSTVEATRRVMEQKKRKRRGVPQRVDDEAAALILQTFLDHLRLQAAR